MLNAKQRVVYMLNTLLIICNATQACAPQHNSFSHAIAVMRLRVSEMASDKEKTQRKWC